MSRGGKSASFIDHIYDKLLHLKAPKFINNPYILNKYESGKKDIADFVLKQSKQNFENVEKDIETFIKSDNQKNDF